MQVLRRAGGSASPRVAAAAAAAAAAQIFLGGQVPGVPTGTLVTPPFSAATKGYPGTWYLVDRYMCPHAKNSCVATVGPFRTAVPFGGHITWNLSDLFPKWD